MKIAVVTCTTENRKWLYDLTNPTKEKYCKKYNVDYIFRTDVYYDKDYLPGWNKILFILEYLNKYDYVMWMDDEWTVVSADHSLSAHYENTILITDNKPEILSLTEDEKAAGFLELF